MTTRKTTIAGLDALGYKLIQAKTRKYLVYQRGAEPRLWLIGRSGALRALPHGGAVADSLSSTGSRAHRAICEIGRPEYHWESAEQAQAAFTRIMTQ